MEGREGGRGGRVGGEGGLEGGRVGGWGERVEGREKGGQENWKEVYACNISRIGKESKKQTRYLKPIVED